MTTDETTPDPELANEHAGDSAVDEPSIDTTTDAGGAPADASSTDADDLHNDRQDVHDVDDVDDVDDDVDLDRDDANVIDDKADRDDRDDVVALDTPGEGPSGPPAVAKLIASLGILALVVGLVFAVISGRTPPVYAIDGDGVSREEMAEIVAEIDPAIEMLLGDLDNATPEEAAQVGEAVEVEIIYTLVVSAANERGIELTDADIEARVADLFQVEGDDPIAAAAEQSGNPAAQVRRSAEFDLLRERLLEVLDVTEPTEDEILAVYEEQFAANNLSVITTATEEEAQDAYDRLEAGEDFNAVATEVDPNGGPVGPLDPSIVPPEIADTVLSLDVGEYSEPVEAFGGWVLFAIYPAATLEEVSDQIAAQLRSNGENAALQAAITEAEESADITVDPILGEWVNGEGIVPAQAAAPAQQLPLGPAEGQPAQPAEPAQDQPAEPAEDQ